MKQNRPQPFKVCTLIHTLNIANKNDDFQHLYLNQMYCQKPPSKGALRNSYPVLVVKNLKNTYGRRISPNISIANISDKPRGSHTQKSSKGTNSIFTSAQPTRHKSVTSMSHVTQPCYMETIKKF